MTGFAIQTRKVAKQDNNSFHANRKVLVDLLDIATAQEPGMLKAITTGTFFMIGRVVLSIND